LSHFSISKLSIFGSILKLSFTTLLRPNFTKVLSSSSAIASLFYLTFNEGKVKPDIIASKPIEQPVVMPDESYNYNDMTRVDG
ncbi:hypothetical protein VWO06_10000, partial [Campylobacter coli]